jgi:hypothetical protein
MSRARVYGFLIASGGLATLFLTVLTREEPTLHVPLLKTDLIATPGRKDVVVQSDAILEGTLKKNPTESERYILRGTVVVPTGTTVTIGPGAMLYAERDARVVVEGTLVIERSQWSSNQRHPSQRFWHGLTAREGGSITMRAGTIRDATAAMTCADRGVIHVENSDFVDNVVGVTVLPGSSCTIANARIERGRVGIHIVGGTPTITNVTFRHLTDALRVFHEAVPKLTALTMSDIGRYAVLYQAEPPLVIHGLSWRAGRALNDAILDGADHPTHVWQNEDVPTGRVTALP